MSFFDSFLSDARAAGLFPFSVNRVMVACSGGMDSVFLLHVLWHCQEELGLDLCVVTCDHGLRADSAADAEWVRHLAWSLGLPCHMLLLEVPARRRKGESVETAARRMRREGLWGLSEKTGAETVALGHHLDDQAETVLMRLCRGTGTLGAGGMASVSEAEGLRWVRPLLNLRRAEIRDQMRAWGRTWREDESNRDTAHTRNRVRHGVLPRLRREVNTRAAEHLAGFARQQRELEAWAQQEAAKALKRLGDEEGLKLKGWRQMPKAARERVMILYLESLGVSARGAGYERLTDFFEALMRPGGESRRWRFGSVRLVAEADRLHPVVNGGPVRPLTMRPPGALEWPPLGRRFEARRVSGVDRAASARSDFEGTCTAYIRMPEEVLEVRSPKRGDRYVPLGMSGSVKLSDLWINGGVPRSQRARRPVVTCGEEIVWVPGYRVAEGWRAPEEGPCLELRLRGLDREGGYGVSLG